MQTPFHGLSRWLSRPALRIPAIALLFLSLNTGGVTSQARAQTEPEGVEVLTRGPVHEAFATTINFKSTEGLISPQAPPEDIQEIPPEHRPDGDKVTWIPGYWGWDDETNGFLWVSGIWRNLPPGRQWIPGYWWDSAQGYQWISGYWADAETDEVEYLSEPPASLEAGPNVAAPSRSHTWIPGTWRWSDSRYAWQPGYWYEAQPDWVWVPPYYSWAPQGWLYVDGYYDYDMPRRGLVFAPVRFSAGYASRPDHFYRPTTVISLAVFSNHLFLRPRNRHYYFGDYYAPEYRQSGYYASFNYSSSGYGYDPIYSHERWRHRDDNRWERRHKDNFEYYRDNKSARPPRTLAALGDFLSRPDRNRRVTSDFATRLDQFSEQRDSPVRLRKVDEAEQKTFARRGQEIREFGDQRRKLTRPGQDPAQTVQRRNDEATNKKPDEGKSVKVRMRKSPVMSRVAEGANRPPSRPQAPADREKSGEKKDPNPGRQNPEIRTDNTGRGNRIEKPVPDSAAEPAGPRRDARVQEPKPRPNINRKEPPAKVTPKVDPKREATEKKTQNPQPAPRRASPPPVPKSKPAANQPKEERNRESKAPATRGVPVDPKPKPKPVARAAPKRESTKAEPKRESPAPPQKAAKAPPRPQPATPSPAPEKPKKGKSKPVPEKDKKQSGDD